MFDKPFLISRYYFLSRKSNDQKIHRPVNLLAICIFKTYKGFKIHV